MRNLPVERKITIFRTLAIPNIIYFFLVTNVPTEIIKKYQTVITK